MNLLVSVHVGHVKFAINIILQRRNKLTQSFIVMF